MGLPAATRRVVAGTLAWIISHTRGVTSSAPIRSAPWIISTTWVRFAEAGQHLFISNRDDIVPSAPLYLHPIFVISGALWRAGLDLRASLIVWKPVAVLVMFGASPSMSEPV